MNQEERMKVFTPTLFSFNNVVVICVVTRSKY